jgi:hypothetical protein
MMDMRVEKEGKKNDTVNPVTLGFILVTHSLQSEKESKI